MNASFRAELIISNVLRWGVAISLILITLGTAAAFIQPGEYGLHGGTAEDFHRLLTQPDLSILTFSGFLAAAKAGHGVALIAPGLLLLIVTPVLRVAVSIAAFAVAKDGAYVVITSAVLGLVLLSFFL